MPKAVEIGIGLVGTGIRDHVGWALASMVIGLASFLITSPVSAAERKLDGAINAALGESDDLKNPERPAKLPDFTKGEVMPPPPKGGWPTWNMGPTEPGST